MLNQRVVQAVQVVYLADMHKKDGQRQVKTDLKTAWKSKCPKTCRDFQLPASTVHLWMRIRATLLISAIEKPRISLSKDPPKEQDQSLWRNEKFFRFGSQQRLQVDRKLLETCFNQQKACLTCLCDQVVATSNDSKRMAKEKMMICHVKSCFILSDPIVQSFQEALHWACCLSYAKRAQVMRPLGMAHRAIVPPWSTKEKQKRID